MTSAIDSTKPTTGTAYTADVRSNFSIAAFEITALQDGSIPGLASTASTSLGDALVGVKHTGTGATARTQHDKNLEIISPYDFGGTGDGVANDSAAVLAASVAAVAAGRAVTFTGGTWLLGTQLALTVSHTNLRWNLQNATIKKGFSGNMVTLNAAVGFTIDGAGTIDGQSVTYTGKGFVFSGASSSPYFGPGIIFKAFADAHLEFGSDSGKYAKIYCDFQPDAVQTDYLAVNTTGLDTAAAYRKMIGSIAVGGYHNLVGAFDTYIADCGFKRVVTDATCSITKISNCRWGNAGSAMTISGANTDLIGNKFAGSVTLDANWSGVWQGNEFTSGSLTVTPTGVNSVIHKSGSVFTIGLTSYYANGAYRVLGDKVTSCGDSDQTFSVGGNGPTMQYKNILGANRTVTLSTTGAVNGDWCLVTRTGGDSAGPWTVSVGGLKSLSQNQWALAKYDGSVWFLAEFGTL